MKRITMVIVFMMCSVVYANAETYTWTDTNGEVYFTDDPGQIPVEYRATVKAGEDITTSNPAVRQEVREQEERARREELDRLRVAPTPGYETAPLRTPEVELREERARRLENTERRELEEKVRHPEHNTNIRR
jgi:uncharacterized membrane protein